MNLQIVRWINDIVAKGKVTSFAAVKPKHVVKLLNKISEADDAMKRLVDIRIPNILEEWACCSDSTDCFDIETFNA